ncbi:MAG: DUF5362 family protein [Flavitalea sp.]
MDEQVQIQSENLFDLQVDAQSSGYLAEAAKWGKFLSIVGFILCALMALGGIFAGSMMGSVMSSASEGMGSAIGGGVFTVIYFLMALLWFMPCLYLYRFSTKAQSAIRANEQSELVDSMKNLKSCFRFMGIMMIILLAFYALIFMIAIGTAMVTSF